LLDGVNQPLLVNNDISARTYVDLGLQFQATDRLTLSANVNNLFDREPPISPAQPLYYDAVGRYFTAGARMTF
jgi:iron complex outermembrane recepter protein